MNHFNRFAMTAVPALCVALQAYAYPTWVEGGTYAAGTIVAYQGHDYKALTTHTAYVGTGWTPSTTPTLWQDLGTQSNGTPTPTPTPVPTPGGCTPWGSTTVYTAGQCIIYKGKMYRAKWWAQNAEPGIDPWGPWEYIGDVSVPPTPTPTPVPTPVGPTPVQIPPEKVSAIATGNSVAISWTTAPRTMPSVNRWDLVENGTVVFSGTYDNKSSPSCRDYWYTSGQLHFDGHICSGGTTLQNVAAGAHTYIVNVYFSGDQDRPIYTTEPFSVTVAPPVQLSGVEVKTWRGAAKGAYSMVHDDFCNSSVSQSHTTIAEPELTKRGLVAAFGAITAECQPAHWTAAQTFVTHGHEIANHSRNHLPAGSSDANWVNSVEIGDSVQDVKTNLNGYQMTYFIWPYDTATDAALAYLRTQPDYLGGRGSNRDLGGGNIEYVGRPAGVNAANFSDPYMVKWDVFTASGQWSLYPMGSEILNLHVDAAIDQGGWATRTMHGVSDNAYDGYEPVPVARYLGHLDYVKAKVDAGLLWVATPSNVIRYRYAREACAPTLNGSQVVFNAGNADCVKYATPLTLELSASVSAINVKQGATALAVKALGGGKFRVDADPLAGPLSVFDQ